MLICLVFVFEHFAARAGAGQTKDARAPALRAPRPLRGNSRTCTHHGTCVPFPYFVHPIFRPTPLSDSTSGVCVRQ